MAGLWMLKIALLLACAGVVLKTLKLLGLPVIYQAAGVAFWSAGVLPYSDIRPELFSLLFFLTLLYILEKQRRVKLKPCAKEAVGVFLLFALWANLHTGFIVGLALAGLYGAWWALAAAVAGTLCNPYGLGPYEAAWEHLKLGGELARNIKEWHPLSFENPLYWPLWSTVFICGGLTTYRLAGKSRKTTLPWKPVIAMVGLGAGALARERMVLYFNAAAVAALAIMAGPAFKKPAVKKLVWAWLAAYAIFVSWLAVRVPWTPQFNYQYVCRRAASFIERERAAVEGLRLYNQWEWGGYLGWKLAPWYRVAQDGRYIFHGLLEQAAQAGADSGKWRQFMEQKMFDGALLPNLDQKLPSLRRYPDGSTRPFLRPWYFYYMPRERWALVYWDDQALFFIKRGAVAQAWLARHEYRYLRPKDEAALADALSRREIPEDQLAAERLRHDAPFPGRAD